MKDGVIIIEVKPKMFDITNEPGKSTFRLCNKKELYEVNHAVCD